MALDISPVAFAKITANLRLLLDQHQNEFGHFRDPVHLDLHLAASQNVIYRDLLTIQSEQGRPLICALGAHYFAYDRTRLTKIMAPSCIIGEQFGPALSPDHLTESDIIFLNHVVMMTYRQIFRERRTLNGWLLRMSEADLLNGEGIFELLVLDKPRRDVPYDKEGAVILSPELASLLIPDEFLSLFTEMVYLHWNHYRRCIGATERFGVAAALFKDVEDSEPKWRTLLPPLDAVEGVPEYRQGEERIRRVLRFMPKNSRPNKELEIRKDIFKMLQSTVLYLRLYKACQFVSLTTRANGFPYGVTVLTSQVIESHQIAELHRSVEQVGELQHDSVESLLRDGRRPKLPEHISLHSTDTEFKNYPDAGKIWSMLIDGKRIPGHALAVFLKVLEHAAAMRVENQHPRLAFVLSQSSYLESVGFVTLEEWNPVARSHSYLELADQSSEKSLCEGARFYELDRWETGRGILPYDLVRNVKSDGKGNGLRLEGFLKRLNYPDPGSGFHLLDLDAHFVYPQIGINCVRRLQTGIIGKFQVGAPPGHTESFHAYSTMSREVHRFVAGITDDKKAVLIFDGRIWAEFREGRWLFYNHESALRLLEKLSNDLNPEVAEIVLDSAQRLSMNRHGAILVLTNLSRSQWDDGGGQEYFMPPPELDVDLERLDTDGLDLFVRLAEQDGCCVIGRNGELLSYRRMINVQSKVNQAAQAAIEELAIAANGSRHHHSALLAFASGWPVICISSDGPATLMSKAEAHRLFPSPR